MNLISILLIISRKPQRKAIDDNYSKYPPVPGYQDLREAIADKFKKENGIDVYSRSGNSFSRR